MEMGRLGTKQADFAQTTADQGTGICCLLPPFSTLRLNRLLSFNQPLQPPSLTHPLFQKPDTRLGHTVRDICLWHKPIRRPTRTGHFMTQNVPVADLVTIYTQGSGIAGANHASCCGGVQAP